MEIPLFLLVHFTPIFMSILGVVPTAYFFFKIKIRFYRVFLLYDFSVTLLFVYLAINELKYIFFEGATLGHKHTKLSKWEIFNLLNLFRKIFSDLFIYYLYTHTKIVISNKSNKVDQFIAFITQNDKIYKTTLTFGVILIILIPLIVELFIEKDQSLTYSLLKAYLTNR